MDVKRAVARVVKWTKKKQGDLSRYVRLLSSTDDEPARMWASDGKVSCLVYLDAGVELPDVLVDGSWLTKAVRGSKVGVEVWMRSPTQIVFAVDGIEIDGQAKPVAGYPEVPEVPKLRKAEGFKVVPLVARFAADYHPYDGVRFAHRWVEASDGIVAVRGDLDNMPEGLFSARLFSNWSSGQVSVGSTDECGFFRAGDELRVGYRLQGDYPDLTKVLPFRDPAPWVSVYRQMTLTALTKAIEASDQGNIELSWTGTEGRVNALGANGSVLSSYPLLIKDSNLSGGQSVVVAGRPVVAALAAMWAARVWLRISQAGVLRLESGPFTVAVWPMQPGG